MTNPDGVRVVDLVREERVCGDCGRTYAVLTDLPGVQGGCLCLPCLIRLQLMRKAS